MGKKLYVGNLSYGISDSDLQRLFEPHGVVQSAQVIIDRDTGRSKGFGFVEMGSDQEAQAAISALNGKEIEGRPLTVNEARPKTEGGGSRGGGGGGGVRRATTAKGEQVCARITQAVSSSSNTHPCAGLSLSPLAPCGRGAGGEGQKTHTFASAHPSPGSQSLATLSRKGRGDNRC